MKIFSCENFRLYGTCLHKLLRLSLLSTYRLSDLQKVHSSEVSRLQQCLQEETERRTQAQRSLDELRGEVAIGIDEGPLTSSPSSEESHTPRTFSESLNVLSYLPPLFCMIIFYFLVDYVNIASVWVQRLVKNPK